MKKLLLGITTMTAIAAPIASVVACGQETKPAELGGIFSLEKNQRWVRAQQRFLQNGAEAKLTTVSAMEKTSAEQTAWIKSKLPTLKALIVGAVSDESIPVWNAWNTSNKKPVIAYDRLIKGAKRKAYNWYITFDNNRVGFLQAREIVADIYGRAGGNKNVATKIRQLDTTAKIVEYVTDHNLGSEVLVATLAGDKNDSNAHQFYDGAMELLTKVQDADSNFTIPDEFNTFDKVTQPEWSYNKGELFLADAFSEMVDNQSIRELAAVLAPNDGMAQSAITALKANDADVHDIYITGQDANNDGLKSIKDGTGQNMTVHKSSNIETKVAINLAKFLIDNPADNVAPIDLADGELDKILAYINHKLGSGISMKYIKKIETAPGKPINTIMLEPEVINEVNLSGAFPDLK